MKSCFKYFVLLFSVNLIEGSFRCDYKYSERAQAWFKLVVMPANWFDARLRCSLEGAALASPTSPETLAEMRTMMNRSYPGYEIFTGIHATVSQGDYYTIEGTPLSQILVSWAENEPNNKDDNERCITLNGNGEIADRRCEETRPYICYRRENLRTEVTECGTLDPEYNLDKRTNKCYKLHTVPRNFSRASMACSAEGGHLAIINSAVEAQVLIDLYYKFSDSMFTGTFSKDYVFIGFQDWGEAWDYKTVEGQTLLEAGYNTFYKREPNAVANANDACGSMYRNGYLLDSSCNNPVPFICEKSPDFPAVCHAFPDKDVIIRNN